MIDFDLIKKWFFEQLKQREIVIQLILLNVVLYLLGLIINLLGMPFGFTGATKLASHFSELWLYVPSEFSIFIRKPFTLLTYQFLHYGFFHLFSNMIILYYFGNLFIQLTHKKKLLALYLYGGFFSAIIFLLVFNLNPVYTLQSKTLVGASGSVMAILAAVVTLIPNQEIALFGRFQIKFKWIAFFFVFINLLGLNTPEAAGSFAHLGGLLFGYLFILASKKGIDLSKSFNVVYDKIVGFLSFKKKPELTFVNDKFKNKKTFTQKPEPKKDIDVKENQRKIDAILDKISQSGYDKLTKAEKDFLFKNSSK